LKAVAAYQKSAKTVPEKPATSRLFNAQKNPPHPLKHQYW
jgi:hypothetical protein